MSCLSVSNKISGCREKLRKGEQRDWLWQSIPESCIYPSWSMYVSVKWGKGRRVTTVVGLTWWPAVETALFSWWIMVTKTRAGALQETWLAAMGVWEDSRFDRRPEVVKQGPVMMTQLGCWRRSSGGQPRTPEDLWMGSLWRLLSKETIRRIRGWLAAKEISTMSCTKLSGDLVVLVAMSKHHRKIFRECWWRSSNGLAGGLQWSHGPSCSGYMGLRWKRTQGCSGAYNQPWRLRLRLISEPPHPWGRDGWRARPTLANITSRAGIVEGTGRALAMLSLGEGTDVGCLV